MKIIPNYLLTQVLANATCLSKANKFAIITCLSKANKFADFLCCVVNCVLRLYVGLCVVNCEMRLCNVNCVL